MTTVAGTASLSVSPGWGPSGSSFTVKGTGFDASQNVEIYWDVATQEIYLTSIELCDTCTTFEVPARVPDFQAVGTHSVDAIANVGSGASASFQVPRPTPSIKPTTAPWGVGLTLTGSAWPAETGIQVRWGTLMGISQGDAARVDAVKVIAGPS